jgi:hypothetical protein
VFGISIGLYHTLQWLRNGIFHVVVKVVVDAFVAVVVVDVVMVFAQADSEAFQCNLQHKLRDLPEKCRKI